MSRQNHEFTELLTGQQQRLFRYIVSLLGNAEAAWDVLQETNRVLLEKQNEFEPGSNFVNWAITVAQFQTMAWLRNQRRDRLLATPEIVEALIDDARQVASADDRIEALTHCLQGLSNEHRQLLHRRYALSERLTEMSQRTGRTVNALKQMFFRLRGTLLQCIEQRLQAK